MSSELFARNPLRAHVPAGLSARYRHRRSQPHRSLGGPVLAAAALAVAGHLASSASAATPAVSPSLYAQAVPAVLTVEPAGTDSLLAKRSTLGLDVMGRRPAPRRTAVAASRGVARRPAVAAAPRWRRPARGTFTSAFGRRWGRMHEGIDIAAPHGSPVLAAFDGVVIAAGYEGGYGKQVKIRHKDGIVTTYSHMSKIEIASGRVKSGDVIGRIGSTGHSTGPHLHFEVLRGGQPINPRTFLAAHGVRY